MQQRLLSAVWLSAPVLMAAACSTPAVGQEPAGTGETVQPGQSSPWPYRPDAYQQIPGPPQRPVPSSRPESWPGTPAAPRQWDSRYPSPQGPPPQQFPPSGYPHPAQDPRIATIPQRPHFPGQPPAGAPMEPLEGAKILARVGSEVILASEVLAQIDALIQPYKDQYPADVLQRQRDLLIQQRLGQLIETKLIYLDARQTLPEEAFPDIEQNLGRQFTEVELPKMIQQAKVQTRGELEQKLRELGTSLQRRKRAFAERALAQSWVRDKVKSDREITYDEMYEYYREHEDEFDNPARVRWRELMVRFSKYPSRAEAGAAIAVLGNRVCAGEPFEQVARTGSHGSTAPEGGARDWTNKGSLVCEVLDRALFDPILPVGRLSQILESKDGFHIVWVTERQQAHLTPFTEAQVEIEPKIKRRWLREQFQAYLSGLREKIPVWTVYDGVAQTSTGG